MSWGKFKVCYTQKSKNNNGKTRKIITTREIKMWNTGIAQETKETKQAQQAFLPSKSAIDRIEYELRSAILKREKRQINRQHWERYVADVVYYVHGRHYKDYDILNT